MNRDVAPTADFARNSDLDLSRERMEAARARRRAATTARASSPRRSSRRRCSATRSPRTCSCSAYAVQLGRLPVSLAALDRAIELNGRAGGDEPARLRLGPAARARPRRGRDGRAAAAARRRRGAAREHARRDRRAPHRAAHRATRTRSTPSATARSSRASPSASRPRRAGRDALAARRGPRLRQAARLQGRVRGGAALHRRQLRRAARARVRGRLPRSSSTSRRSSCPPGSRRATPRPAACGSGASRRRSIFPVFRAIRPLARPARHALRSVRLDARTAAGSGG